MKKNAFSFFAGVDVELYREENKITYQNYETVTSYFVYKKANFARNIDY